MPAPFYNAVKGTTAGTPGTGAFTPNAAASGFRAWSLVPTGWIGLVRYEDGSAWELSYSYWNGTTLSRASTQLVDSSTGSALSLTSASTAAFVIDASEVQSHLGTTRFFGWSLGPTVSVNLGGAPSSTIGTQSFVAITATNMLTQTARGINTSATTVNAQCGWHNSANPYAVVSTTAGLGGYEFVCRFGASGLPTGPRLLIGMLSATFVANTAEPSAFTANVAAFGLDSTDTNIQLLVNSNASTCTKTDTGIPLAVNGWYEASIWTEPGSTTVYALLIRLDTGAIWTNALSGTSTDVPVNGALLFPQIVGGLNGTNTGTAFVMNSSGMTVRAGS